MSGKKTSAINKPIKIEGVPLLIPPLPANLLFIKHWDDVVHSGKPEPENLQFFMRNVASRALTKTSHEKNIYFQSLEALKADPQNIQHLLNVGALKGLPWTKYVEPKTPQNCITHIHQLLEKQYLVRSDMNVAQVCDVFRVGKAYNLHQDERWPGFVLHVFGNRAFQQKARKLELPALEAAPLFYEQDKTLEEIQQKLGYPAKLHTQWALVLATTLKALRDIGRYDHPLAAYYTRNFKGYIAHPSLEK